jgi:hypothetical protein
MVLISVTTALEFPNLLVAILQHNRYVLTTSTLTCQASLPLAGAGLLHSEEWLGIQPL